MVEDLKIVIDHLVYTNIGIKFQNICDAANFLDCLTKQNYDDLETLLLIFLSITIKFEITFSNIFLPSYIPYLVLVDDNHHYHHHNYILL